MEEDASVKTEPEEAHRWLEQLLGDWTVRTEGVPETGTPWTEKVRSLQGLWVVCEGQGTMPDGRFGQTVMTLGFNPETRRFVGTWVGSMMTHMWIYDGELEPDGLTLSLYADGPDFDAPGKLASYRDAITLEGHSRRWLAADVRTPDGAWKELMTAEYNRL